MRKERIRKLAALLRSKAAKDKFNMRGFYILNKGIYGEIQELDDIIVSDPFEKFMSPNSCGCIAGYAAAIRTSKGIGKPLQEITFRDIKLITGEEGIEAGAKSWLEITEPMLVRLFYRYPPAYVTNNFVAARCLEILAEEGHVDWKRAAQKIQEK